MKKIKVAEELVRIVKQVILADKDYYVFQKFDFLPHFSTIKYASRECASHGTPFTNVE